MKRISYEPSLSVLAALARPGDVVIDIGANFGVYSLLLAKRVGESGEVYAFEPGHDAAEQLAGNLKLNGGYKNVHLIRRALSNRSGTSSLFHIGGPVTYSLGGSGEGESVSLTTLDAWASEVSLAAVNLIKIDVEGHEPAAFDGGRALISRMRPIIMFEVSYSALNRNEYAHDASYTRLKGLGYDVFRLQHDQLVKVDKVEEGNLFAIHPDSAREPARRQR